MSRKKRQHLALDVDWFNSPEHTLMKRKFGAAGALLHLAIMMVVRKDGLETGGVAPVTVEELARMAGFQDVKECERAVGDLLGIKQALDRDSKPSLRVSWKAQDLGILQLVYPQVVERHSGMIEASERLDKVREKRWSRSESETDTVTDTETGTVSQINKEINKEIKTHPPTPLAGGEARGVVEEEKRQEAILPGALQTGLALTADLERLVGGKLTPRERTLGAHELAVHTQAGFSIEQIQEVLATWGQHYGHKGFKFILERLRGRLQGEPGPVWLRNNQQEAKKERQRDEAMRDPARRDIEATRKLIAQREAEADRAASPEEVGEILRNFTQEQRQRWAEGLGGGPRRGGVKESDILTHPEPKIAPPEPDSVKHNLESSSEG